jgi:hypothetical protein
MTMDRYKIVAVITALVVSVGLCAENNILNNSSNSLLQCAMLPITKTALDAGEVDIKIVKYLKKDNDEDITLLLSPGNINTSYKVKDGIIISMTVSHNQDVLYSYELRLNKSDIFPLSNQGDWAAPISSSLAVALQDINILTCLASCLNGNNKSFKLKLKNIPAGKGDWAYELSLPDSNLIRKYYWGDGGFLVEDYIANKKKLSFEFHKNKYIRFSNLFNEKAIEVSFKDETLIFVEKKGVIKKYDKEGNSLTVPPFRIRIVK